MDSQTFFILENNVLMPIDQADICYIITSESLLPLSNDNIILNLAEESFVENVEPVCNFVEQLTPVNEEELYTSGLSFPIEEGSNEIFLEYNQAGSKPITDENTNQDTELMNIQNLYNCEHCATKFPQLKLLNRHKRTHVYEKRFKCDKCHETFNFSVNLKVHSIIHQDTLKNVCCICNRIFRRFSSLRGHLNSHAVSEYFNCEHCDEIFLGKIFYDCHLEKYHKKEGKETKIAKVPNGNNVANVDRDCKICGKLFKKPSMLVRHMRVHNGEKPFKCNICERKFSQKNSLTTHLLLHTGKKPFPCTLCCRRFTQKCNLKLHKERVHNKYSLNTDANKYPCNKCSCSFRKIASLNRHITEFHSANARESKFVNPEVTSKGDLNFNEILSQINELKQIQASSTEEEMHEENKIQLADRLENGILLHRNVQQLKTDRGKNKLSCLNCGKQFTRPSDLLRHIRVHTKEKPFECYLCKRRFSVKRTLTLHYKTHESTLRKYSCSVCCKNFRDIDTLNRHGAEYHENCNNFLQCFPCKEIFSNAEELQTHTKLHNRRLSVMKRKAYDPSIQMRDPIVVNPEKKNEDPRRRLYKCDECFKRFIKLCHLKQHQLSHTDDRRFRCDKCIKTFKSRNALTIHDRGHLNLKPYKCVACGENFVSKSILNRHHIIHSEVRNFKCPYCQKSFKSKTDCRKHIRIHQEEMLISPLVDPSVSSNDKTDNEQSNIKTCQYCGRYFKKPIDLRRHERIHTGERPFKCDKCEKSFSLASTLKFHQRIHDETKRNNMYTCHVCSNKYASKGSLNLHKRLHTGEKPFKCRYCDKIFRTNGHRSVHESNHLKIAYERGIDPKDVKNIRSSKFESILENFTFN